MEKIFDKVVELTKTKAEEIAENVIYSVDVDMIDGNSFWWQVEHTITEIIDEIETEFLRDDIISYEDNLKSMIDNADRNVRDEMFSVLIEKVVKYCKDKNYRVEIDRHFEEVRAFEDEEEIEDLLECFVSNLNDNLINKEMTVYELDNFIKDEYNSEVEKTSCWDFFTAGETNEYLNNGSYNYCSLFENYDLIVKFEVVEYKEDSEKSIIKIVNICKE